MVVQATPAGGLFFCKFGAAGCGWWAHRRSSPVTVPLKSLLPLIPAETGRWTSIADRMMSTRSSGAAGQSQSRAQHGAWQHRLEAWLRVNYQEANWRIPSGALPNVARGRFHEVA